MLDFANSVPWTAILGRALIIRVILLRTPFPDVAVNIVKTEGVGHTQTTDRNCLLPIYPNRGRTVVSGAIKVR